MTGDAWGGAWGNAWGGAWGAVDVAAPPPGVNTTDRGGLAARDARLRQEINDRNQEIIMAIVSIVTSGVLDT